jgi:CubicO group peptidase (beta-lactamase class C family)
VATTPGRRLLRPGLRYEVDRSRRTVRTTLLGRFAMEAAYHDGVGCTMMFPGATAAPATSSVPAAAAPLPAPEAPPAEPASEALRAAVERAFAEPPGGPPRGTKAVVVMHRGRIVAERYAPGYGPETPMLSWSVAKSVVNALVGILVREGRLSVAGPAPVPEWRDPSDPRHAITIEHLMRMDSGLALDETNSGFDPASRMLITQPDMAGSAAAAPLQAPPGTRYHYSSPSTLLLSRIIRDTVGGGPRELIAFAERELFRPVGMRRVTLEFDGAGTPVGSTYVYATARDWARFGQLYADDGVADGRRILPPGWVDYSAAPTAGSRDGYGAGFFTNRGGSEYARLRVKGGMPPDSFFASGTQGQRIVISPSRRLVVVRLGRSQDWETFDIRGLIRLVAEVDAALGGR